MGRTDWLREAALRLQTQRGFTIHPERGAYEGAGYGVSPYPSRSEQLPADLSAETLMQQLQSFFERNRDVLAKPGHYVGAWLSSFQPSPIVLDIAVVTDSREEAESLQLRYEQRAIHEFMEERA